MPGLMALPSADCRRTACRRRGQTVKNQPQPAPRGRWTTLPGDYCDLPQQGDQLAPRATSRDRLPEPDRNVSLPYGDGDGKAIRNTESEQETGYGTCAE